MRIRVLLAILVLTAAAQAKDPPSYQHGKLLEMQSVSCGYAENGGKSVAGEILGTDSEHKKTQEMLCQEYMLQGEHIIYRIRPTDMKHPILLPIGEVAQYRIHKDKLLLRVPEGDNKEREYSVLSMTPRNDAEDSRSSAARSSQR
jgi:hypothetical protein